MASLEEERYNLPMRAPTHNRPTTRKIVTTKNGCAPGLWAARSDLPLLAIGVSPSGAISVPASPAQTVPGPATVPPGRMGSCDCASAARGTEKERNEKITEENETQTSIKREPCESPNEARTRLILPQSAPNARLLDTSKGPRRPARDLHIRGSRRAEPRAPLFAGDHAFA